MPDSSPINLITFNSSARNEPTTPISMLLSVIGLGMSAREV